MRRRVGDRGIARNRFRNLPLVQQPFVDVCRAEPARFRVDDGLLDNSDLHCSLLMVKLRWPRHVPA